MDSECGSETNPNKCYQSQTYRWESHARDQYFAYCKPDTVDDDFGVTSTSKFNPKSKMISEEKVLKVIRVSVSSALASSCKDNPPCNGSVKVISGRINIRPFINPEPMVGRTSSSNLKSSTGNSACQEEKGMGIMTTSGKKPQTLQSSRQSPHRRKWSREVEKAVSLYALNKDTSKALVGSSLGYTDTSHWCTSSLGYTDTSHWCTSSINNGTTHSIVSRTGESSVKQFTHELSAQSEEGVQFVPLSFDDELERKNVKVLTPRSVNVYKALPIVSETYPVVSRTSQHHCEPFGSPGFHSLDSPESSALTPTARHCTVRSAVVHIAESTQAERVLCLRGRQKGEAIGGPTPPLTSEPKEKSMGDYHHTDLSVFSADGSENRSPDLDRLPLHDQGHVSSVDVSACTNKGLLIPLAVPRVKSTSSARVGHVINCMNPSQNCDPGKIPHSTNSLQGPSWLRLSSSFNTSTLQTQQNTATIPKNKNVSLLSKSVMCRQSGANSFNPKLQTHNADCGTDEKEAQNLHKKFFESPVTYYEGFCVRGVNYSRPPNLNCDFQNTTRSGKGAAVANGAVASPAVTEYVCKINSSRASFHLPQPINIPTAESIN